MTQRTKPPFRGDMVGSLLRSAPVKEARAKVAAGEMDKAELTRIEDEEIRKLVKKQEEVGLQAVTEVAGKPAIVPTITGRGFTFGLSQVALDPFDPMAEGFAMTDVWGPSAGEI